MFDEALALHRQGRLDDAARGYEAVLADEPGHLDALVHLGVLRLAQGRTAEAEALLRRAVAAMPGSAAAQANLAAALQAAGRRDEAVAHYEKALAVDPAMTDARFGLAACLQATGRPEAAIACYEELLAAEPGHAEANYGLAILLAARGRAGDAIKRFRAALAADPDFAEASCGLGGLLARSGELVEAADCFRRSLDVDPDYVEARLALAVALGTLERDAEAIAEFAAVLAAEPEHAEAHLGLAAVLQRSGRRAEAIAHFRDVLARQPERVDAMSGLASVLFVTGDHGEAVELCRKALAIEPQSAPTMDVLGRALAEIGDLDGARAMAGGAVALAPDRPEFCFNLVQFAKVAPDDAAVSALEAMLPRVATMSPREQCWVHFALAKAYDDIGEHDRSFAHLAEGNAIKRRHTAYDEARAIGPMDHIRRAFTRELIAARGGRGDPSELPVFIVGMPRSGTTLVEQILASHPMVFGAGERLDLSEIVRRLAQGRGGAVPFPECVATMTRNEMRRAGGEYLAALRALAPAAARITDKMPGNFHWVGLIALILPNARIIHLQRDPVDTALSCFSKLFADGQLFTYDLAELGRYIRAYQRLMAHWRAALPQAAMLEVRYESLVADFEAEARRILEYCGLPWDDACREFYKAPRPVHTASVVQVRQPIYTSSVGRWRPQPALLQPLLDALAEE